MTSLHLRRMQSRVARTTARFVDLAARDRLTVADLPAVRLPWYEIRNDAGQEDNADGGDAATVFIFDEIGGSFGVDAKTFAAELEQITTPKINVRINSPGGSVFDAIAIHSALLHHPAVVRSYVDGLAASAASVIAMAADPLDEVDDTGGIVMMPGAEMMIHDASTVVDGNEADLTKMATWVGRQSANIADMYRQRAGGTADEWRELMLAETWMFGHEAVEMGLADRVYERPQPADERMTRSFDLGGYRYAGRRHAPAPARRRSTTHGRPAAPASRPTEGRRTPVTTTERSRATTADHRAAAQARAAGASRVGYRQPGQRQQRGAAMPAGAARSVEFPAELRAVLETRRGQELYHLFGQATVFGVRYEMWDEFGPYWEKVNHAAGDKTLAASPDVAFLVNHRGVTMARTTNGTLELGKSSGIDVDAWLNPKRQDVSDFVIAVEDRNVTEMSFAFMLEDGVWNADFTEFEIMQFDLHRGDVSGVNYGANPATSIDARQREVLADLDRMSPALGRAAVSLLLQRSDLDVDELFDRFASGRQTLRPAAPAIAGPGEARGRSIAHIEALLLD